MEGALVGLVGCEFTELGVPNLAKPKGSGVPWPAAVRMLPEEHGMLIISCSYTNAAPTYSLFHGTLGQLHANPLKENGNICP